MAELDKLLVSFMVDEVVGGFFISVPPGHIACLYDRGRGVLKKVWGPGLHLKIPFWQVAKLFNAQVVEYTIRHGFDLSHKEALGDEPLNTVTSDNKVLVIEGSILFHIDKNNAPSLWENIGDNFVSKVVRPVSRSKIRIVIAETTSSDIKNKRPMIEVKIKEELNILFMEKGLVCDGVLLSEIKLLGDQSQESQLPMPTDAKENQVYNK
jgi:regulator of protease activity HflC (stomatin/prohibitin superfamily)